MTTHHFDLCVIGAGAAGLSVASGASQLGLNVALIEKGEMGGECLNVGCVPSKALIAAAKSAQSMRGADKFGLETHTPKVTFKNTHKHIHDVIARIAPHDSQERFEGLGVTVFRDHAQFIDSKTLAVGDKTKIISKKFVIATGSRPFIPSIDGLDTDKILTNENIFDLKELPQHLIIIGGGAIGIEMAQSFKRLGADVTLIERDKIMSPDDREVAKIVQTRLEDEGVIFHIGVDIDNISHQKSGVKVTLSNDETVHGSHILIATGRTPNTNSLGLKNAKVRTDERGAIITDKRLRTSQHHILALGDCIGGDGGGPKLTHAAGYQAGIIIRNICFKLPAKVDYSALPWVTYADPEVAHVGLTEERARKIHGNKVHITKWAMKGNDRSIAERKTDGLVKIISLDNGKILGASIVAPRAGEMIGIWTLALSKGMKMKDIASVIAPYPTFGEASKHVAGAFYKDKLFSDKTRFIVRLLQKLPF